MRRAATRLGGALSLARSRPACPRRPLRGVAPCTARALSRARGVHARTRKCKRERTRCSAEYDAFLAANPLPGWAGEEFRVPLAPAPGASPASERRLAALPAAQLLAARVVHGGVDVEPVPGGYACAAAGAVTAPRAAAWTFHAPQSLPPTAGEAAAAYALRLSRGGEPDHYAIVLATAEEVVVGAYVQGEVAFSKVTTAYTRRRKQGRAQLHFKRSNKGGGGGRSEGARLRARETVRLFAEGGEALASACELLPSDAPLFYAGDARVMEELCAGAAAAPGAAARAVPPRTDPRWVRATGVQCRRPRQADLERVRFVLTSAREVVYE